MNRSLNDIMGMDQLKFMKAMAAERGEWKEVERLNKAIRFNVLAAQFSKKATRTSGRTRARGAKFKLNRKR